MIYFELFWHVYAAAECSAPTVTVHFAGFIIWAAGEQYTNSALTVTVHFAGF